MVTSPSTLDALRATLRRLEGGFGDPTLRRVIATGLPALDRALPGGGLPAAAVCVLLSPEPAWTLAVLIAAAAVRVAAGDAVLVDRAGELFPPGLVALGLPLDRALIVRPGSARDAAWALEEALSSPACAVAVGEVRRPPAACVRRLALAAEAGRGIALVLAREREAGDLLRAPVVLRVRQRPHAPVGSTFLVEVVRCRGRPLAQGEEPVQCGTGG